MLLFWLATALAAPPEGWTDLATLEHVRLDVRYATADNFTGAPLPGYEHAGAWLRDEPAQALQRVANTLAEQGLELVVHDAYRPVRATLAMVAWAERTEQTRLLDEGYIARSSGHNRGHTIDLTVAPVGGEPWDMGTPYDTFGPEAWTAWGEGEVRTRRDRLVAAMAAEGWRNYRKEWWHFSYKLDGTAPVDVPYTP